MRRSEPPKIRKTGQPPTAGSVARPLPAPRPPPPVVARASTPPPRVKLPLPVPPPRRASDPPPPLDGGAEPTLRKNPSRLPPAQPPPTFGRPLVIEASTAEVAAGTLETLSAEFEPTRAGPRIANPAGTPSQVRALEPHGAKNSSREIHTPRASDDDLMRTERETDLRTKRETADGYAHTHRAPGLLTSVHRADAETLDLPDSVPTPSYPFDSSELPTANIVAVGPSKPVVMPPPSQPGGFDTNRKDRPSAPRDAFFFVDHDSERTLAREVASLPLVTPQVRAISATPGLETATPIRGSASDSLDAFQPSNFLGEASSSFDAMSVQTGDILPTAGGQLVSTQPLYANSPAPPSPVELSFEAAPRPPSSAARNAGATRVLPTVPGHSSSHPPPPHASAAPPPPPQQRPRPQESGSLDAFPPLRFGGEPARGYHPAPAPQWGPPAPHLAETGIVQRPAPPVPASVPAPPPRTLRWVALGLVLGAAIVLVGYRYLLRPIDPRPTVPMPLATALPPAPPSVEPPAQLQTAPIPVVPIAPTVPAALAPSAPAPVASTPHVATVTPPAAPKAPPAVRPPPASPPPRAQSKPAAGGDPPPRPLNPDPPPAPEPMPGQSILDNAL